VQCLDPTGRNPETWSVRGKDLAIKLKNVMDKIKQVVLPVIPDKPTGKPYEWYTSNTGNIVIGPIADEDVKDQWGYVKGEWRFTPRTLKTIDALYQKFESAPIVEELKQAGVEEELSTGLWLQRHMPDVLRKEFLSLQWWQWLGIPVLAALGWLVKLISSVLAAALLGYSLRRRKIEIEQTIKKHAGRSVGGAVMVLFWWYAAPLLQLPDGVLNVLQPALRFVLVVTAVWVGYRLVDVVGGYIAANKEIQLTHFDDVLIPFLRKILRVVVVIVVVVFVLEWMGHKPTTILGALGIGGVALAFAAQDTLGNFFGSITVLLDRPFGLGDWISIGEVEGTVERVGFRSTRVRTFYNSLITIPNSKMGTMHVDNYGARRYRRIRVILSVTYSTSPEKIDAFCEGIRELIRLHPYTRKDYYHVYFNKFSASSLDILLYMFLDTPDWGTELRERHNLFLDILRLAQRLEVEFAFPTQTLVVQRGQAGDQPPSRAVAALDKEDADTVGIKEAAKLYEQIYGAVPANRGPVVITPTPRSKGTRRDGTHGST